MISLPAILFISAILTGIHAAPSIEACPQDSFQIDGNCVCDPDSCKKPPCLSDLVMVRNGTDVPGECCPTYSCEGCANETMIQGQCPCADGAVLDFNGCSCVEEGMVFMDGVCECDVDTCELPIICDDKSVKIEKSYEANNGRCCKKYECKECPKDSYPTDHQTTEMENHCVCYKCEYDCKPNQQLVILEKGTGFPGNCCHFYDCKTKSNSCMVHDKVYMGNESWITNDQQCVCNDGVAMCSKIDSLNGKKYCNHKGYFQKHGLSWRDEECVNCTCNNGEVSCVAHFCEYETKKEFFKPLIIDCGNRQHNSTWLSNCTSCSCNNGTISCLDACESNNVPPSQNCQPLVNCQRKCEFGFKLKNGCETCKCNRMIDELSRFNISVKDFKEMIEVLKSGPTTTTIPTVQSTYATPFMNNTLILGAKCSEVFPILGAIVVLLMVTIITLIIILIKKRNKSSFDISNCKYESIPHNNNRIQQNNNI